HHQVLGVALALVDEVEQGDRPESDEGIDDQLFQHRREHGAGIVDAFVGQLEQRVEHRADDEIDDAGKKDHLERGLDELDQVLHRENLLGIGGRIQLAALGLQGLEGEDDAGLDQFAENTDYQGDQEI